ncbi:hypothetical protein PVAND_000650 [Polypedilum vanderplanki]|uniref:Uncharacterized protein n=1 Tax=Polypedilum vanderplanki TaxID=319348 RepID=A0A9J6BKL3_POLVA|nr:hypothetical protein PVAND_000650 [Polypedilum vanderplanki]
MKNLLFSSLVIITTTSQVLTTMKFILDEKIEICSEEHFVDISKFEFIMVNDTTTVGNGLTKSLKEIKSPWKLQFYGEIHDRGTWIKKFGRKFDDFCKHILNPTEFWYKPFNEKMKGKGCPYNEGMVTEINNEIVYFDVSFMPFTFEGRWRFTIEGELGCYRVYFDFVDI